MFQGVEFGVSSSRDLTLKFNASMEFHLIVSVDLLHFSAGNLMVTRDQRLQYAAD